MEELKHLELTLSHELQIRLLTDIITGMINNGIGSINQEIINEKKAKHQKILMDEFENKLGISEFSLHYE